MNWSSCYCRGGCHRGVNSCVYGHFAVITVVEAEKPRADLIINNEGGCEFVIRLGCKSCVSCEARVLEKNPCDRIVRARAHSLHPRLKHNRAPPLQSCFICDDRAPRP